MSLKSKLPLPSHLHWLRRVSSLHIWVATMAARWPPSWQALLCSKPRETVDTTDKVRKATGGGCMMGLFAGEEEEVKRQGRCMHEWVCFYIYQSDFWQLPKWKDLVVSWRLGIGSGAEEGKTHSKKLLPIHCYLIISFQWLPTFLHACKCQDPSQVKSNYFLYKINYLPRTLTHLFYIEEENASPSDIWKQLSYICLIFISPT